MMRAALVFPPLAAMMALMALRLAPLEDPGLRMAVMAASRSAWEDMMMCWIISRVGK